MARFARNLLVLGLLSSPAIALAADTKTPAAAGTTTTSPTPTAPTATTAPATKTGKTTDKEDAVKGRLPPYYSKVVDESQREKIYKIQSDFAAKIKAAKDQLDQLEAERDNNIKNVLTAEQQQRVLDLATDSKTKRIKTTTTATEPPKKTATTTAPAKTTAADPSKPADPTAVKPNSTDTKTTDSK